ncbi:hypothetical protein GCM10023201_56680 [Actinomycetospora corticicola]|uniref:Cobalamin biosynthesis Mg chelatase CobN n=1 Tax=Actinomycetospora corticicola TaxID=663602 RepID=A0A7Y9E009_9PSEU|nr:hypothetical protein [Actinomycetospora corticicola]NYD38521.1 cobalamin biosynthesis Mg chelatase CobN [Actinomycetospora corticicola]
MAQQGTDEQTSDQQSSDEAAGKHRASDEGADQTSGSSESDGSSKEAESSGEQSTESSEQQSASSEQQSAPSEAKTEKQAASSESKTEKQAAPSESKTEKQSSPSEAKTEKQSAPDDAPTEQHRRGSADTSWAEPETQRRHVDVGEIVWRAGNVIATVVRTLAFLFALVLIVNVVLVLVGVNPANGVAQFIGGVADTVILGFRDLFVPSDPKIALIVNSLVAAVFWVFVGELFSRLIRFIAARVK